MLARFDRIVEDARATRRAVGAFTAYNLETAIAVLSAAEALDRGVILLVSDEAYRRPSGPALLRALRALAEQAKAPACVQLDHVSDLERMRRALADGAGALMADGSKLSYEENVALVAGAVELAAPYGAGVEAELGRIAGNEEVAEAVAAGALTDPEQAADFVARTGADCLAVSIGNVHGRYRSTPRLDWPRLEAIRARLRAPLSLHGASGLDDADIARGLERGIAKINVNTELRARTFAVLQGELPRLAPGLEQLKLGQAVIDAVEAVVRDRLRAFALAG